MRGNLLAGGPRWCRGSGTVRSPREAGAGGRGPVDLVTSKGLRSAQARLGERKDEVWSWTQGPQETSSLLVSPLSPLMAALPRAVTGSLGPEIGSLFGEGRPGIPQTSVMGLD